MSTRYATSRTFPLLLIAGAGLLLGIAVLTPPVLLLLGIGGSLLLWLWLVEQSYVKSFAIFLALIPLWTYLKWLAWPTVTLGGSTLHVATVFKDILLVLFFLHWLVRATQRDNVRVRLPLLVLVYFGIVLLALSQATLVRYPQVLRPYIEMFLLAGVPLLSIQLTKRDIDYLILGLLMGGGFAAIVALYHAYIDPSFLLSHDLIMASAFKVKGEVLAFYGARLQSILGNPNHLGGIAMLTGVASFGFFLKSTAEETYKQQVLFLGIFFLATVALMLAASRDDIGFFALAMLAFVVFERRTVILVTASLVFAVGLLTNLDKIISMFQTLLTEGNPRFKFWMRGIQIYGTELLTGVGNVENLYKQQFPYDNSFLRMFIQIGIFGLLTFVLMNVITVSGILYRSFVKTDRTGFTLGLLLFALLGTFVFRTALFVFPQNLIYWVLFVLSIRWLLLDREDSTGDCTSA